MASSRREAESLGRVLVESGAVTRAQLEAALAAQRKTFLPLGRILRDEHGLAEEALATALRAQRHVPRVYLRFFPVDVRAVALLDLAFCQENEVIAFEKLDGLLCVALANPAQRGLIKRVERDAGLEVKIFQAPWDDIQKRLPTE